MVTLGDIDAGFGPDDDRRHRPEPGRRMRDSLFWELVMPEERLAMQIYLYLTDRGRAGYNAVVWGEGLGGPPLVLLENGQVDDSTDLDDFSLHGLHVKQPELRQTCEVDLHHGDVDIRFCFTALHDAFTYRCNPDGLPDWFAANRLEQTGHVTGSLRVAEQRFEWDRIGHRDHSWGTRDWGVPHHWKWFIAYTETGQVVNGWIWIAYGEWGFGGYVVRDGITVPVRSIAHHAEYDDDMVQVRLEADLLDITGVTTHLVLDSFGAVPLPTHDPMSTVITEAGCVAHIDGVAGGGQFETHWAGPYLDHLRAHKANVRRAGA